MLIVGPAIAVAVSYAMPPSSPRQNAAVSAPALIATFGPTCDWVGRAIIYERGCFIVQRIGAVSARDVLSYREQRYITWAADGMRVARRAHRDDADQGAARAAELGGRLEFPTAGRADLQRSRGLRALAAAHAAEPCVGLEWRTTR